MNMFKVHITKQGGFVEYCSRMCAVFLLYLVETQKEKNSRRKAPNLGRFRESKGLILSLNLPECGERTTHNYVNIK